MNVTDIVVKTAEGSQELKSRAHKLPPRLRTMLIMIDGSLSAGQLQDAAAKLGVPGDFLENLEREGLIAARQTGKQAAATTARPAEDSEVERFRTVQKFMNDTVVDALGFRAFFFTLKLEKCSTRAELTGLINDYAKAIAKGSGEDVARVLRARARDLLG
jgi:hypothetical protein